MLFSRLFFLCLFFPICVLIYFATKKTSYRNAVLIIFSLVFYACGDLAYLWLLVVFGVVNYFFGRGIASRRGKKSGTVLLVLGLILNLGTLVVFKYTGFVLENLNTAFGLDFTLPTWALPLGLSFYTFRVVSYLIDCAWGKTQAERNFFTFFLYLSFFPITVSGPIVRYETMREDFHARKIKSADLSEGLTRISVGLGKKVILADQLAPIVTQFLDSNLSAQTTLGTWYGVILYALQMYFDFSGYSDIAIGIARIFGFHLEENFRHPFLSGDITEFWQRWHISLGTFFRDYLLYVPIFGKRRKYGGLVLVWLCTGIWHGASWNFIIWGVYYGLFMILETGMGKKAMHAIPAVIRQIYSKLVIIIGFGIFYCTGGVDQIGQLLLGLFGQHGTGVYDAVLMSSLKGNCFLIAAAILCCFPITGWIRRASAKNATLNLTVSIVGTVAALGVLIVSMILMVDATYQPFLYTQY